MEDEDDGAAGEYYGPCREFYFALQRGFTVYWGRASKSWGWRIREGRSEGRGLRPLASWMEVPCKEHGKDTGSLLLESPFPS